MGENTEQTTNRKTETTAQMNELNKALLELKKITGISLEVSGAAPDRTCADTDPLSLHSLQRKI